MNFIKKSTNHLILTPSFLMVLGCKASTIVLQYSGEGE